jgi:hypothetical protein
MVLGLAIEVMLSSSRVSRGSATNASSDVSWSDRICESWESIEVSFFVQLEQAKNLNLASCPRVFQITVGQKACLGRHPI